jgi:hypothetical protein
LTGVFEGGIAVTEGFEVAVAAPGGVEVASAGFSVGEAGEAWPVSVGRSGPPVKRGVRTVTVESKGGRVGIAPQEESSSEPKSATRIKSARFIISLFTVLHISASVP